MSSFLPFHLGPRFLVFIIALIAIGCRDRLDFALTQGEKESAHVDFVMEVLVSDDMQTISGRTDAKGRASISIDNLRKAIAFSFSVKQPDAAPLQVSSGGLKNGRLLFQSDRPPYSLTLKP
jgi:hypothetical protein